MDPAPGFGGYLDNTPVFLHDVSDDAETQACSLPGRLGGEERLKNALPCLVRDACALVLDDERQVGSGGRRGAQLYLLTHVACLTRIQN